MTLITEQELLLRRLPLAGTWNLREVGGYPAMEGGSLRRGLLYRSCSLHQIDDEGRAALTDLGLKTVIDLRNQSERDVDPDLLGSVGAKLVHQPLLERMLVRAAGTETETAPPSVTLAEVFALIIEQRGMAIAAAVQELAEPGALPAIVHCTAGKDRTGVVIAITLAALGVPDEVIVADFAATSLFLTEEHRGPLVARSGMADRDSAYLAKMLASDPELMQITLDTVREAHGSAEEYLLKNGLKPEDLARLRENLVAACC